MSSEWDRASPGVQLILRRPSVAARSGGDTRILEKLLKRGRLGAELLRIRSRLSFIIRGSVPPGGSNASRSFNDPDGGTR